MARPKKAQGGMSKMEAVRQAIASLGRDVKTAELLSFLKSNYNVVMSPEMAYNYKSNVLKKKGRKRGRKPGRKPAAAAPANGRRGGGITLEDIQAVKKLADRIGAEKVQQLAAVLAK